MTSNFYYLIHFQYLGFRYHGWQKQPGVKTVQQMVEKTITFILGHDRFKILASGRTDAKVSAERAAFELFVDEPLESSWIEREMNHNLPNDIRVLEVEEVDEHFNIIQSPRVKEYVYLFSSGARNHPFCAPFMVYMEESLNINLMKSAARLFEGEHDFIAFCTKPREDTQTKREILTSEIVENTLYQANFFPEVSYLFRIRGKGFLRHQVRLIMGALFAVGKGELTEQEITEALMGKRTEPMAYMAPQSGLILRDIQFT
jgi:tRNA pseudouridine38-40 synthase